MYMLIEQFVYKYPYLVVIVVCGIAVLLVFFPLVLVCHHMWRKKLVVYRPTPTQVRTAVLISSLLFWSFFKCYFLLGCGH